MKKIISVCILTIMLLSMLPISAMAQEENITINVYNWGEYISDGSEDSLDINKQFTEETGIKVNYTTYTSNEDLYAKLKSGASSYDVIIPSDYMIQQMIEENMLEKLNYDNIPNFEYIDEKYVNPYYDKANEYSVPYTVGMVGIIYNTTMVDAADVGSWNLMWNEKYKNKILQFNNPRDAFGTAQYLLGIDVNTTDVSLWEQALDKLKEQKPLIQGYVMDEIYNKMEKGEAAIAPYYAGDFLTMYENNSDLAFYYPSEGTNFFVDAMCIPKGCKYKAEAEQYINFMLRKDIAVANAEYIYYASPNTQVAQDEDYISTMSEVHEKANEILYPTISDYKTSSYEKLSDKELINNLWEKLKIDSKLNISVYITSGVIVLALVGLVVFFFIRKKKRNQY